MTGATIGPWKLGDEVGRGPLGVVYRATDAADPGRVAAVKVLTAPLTRTPEFLLRFPGEMLPLQQLRHPNVARFLGSGVHSGLGYYASEWIDGTDLAARIKSAKREESTAGWPTAVLGLAAEIARGLKHGHHRNTLHRDLKPTNVRITPDGTARLTDFGVAKAINLPPMAFDPDPFGSAGFLPPEYFTGRPLTRRSDLYSLGCVLYAAVTGRPPYTAGSVAEFMHKHCYVLPDRPSQFCPRLPPEFDDLICTLLNKDPARRPASAAAVLEALDHIRGKVERKGEKVAWPAAVVADEPAEVGDTTEVAEYDRPRPLMSRPWVVIPLFLLLLGVAATIYFWPRPTAEELYARARPLMESNDPADWERAMDEYLDPLADRFPGQHAEEIQAVKTKLRDHRGLRRALADGKKDHPMTEAERLYQRGLALLQAGDPAAARRVWAGLAAGHAGSEADARWVKLATTGAAELVGREPANGEQRLAEVAAAAERAKAAGPDVLDALEQAYLDDPPALAVVRKARGK
jgi:hypothetical protein